MSKIEDNNRAIAAVALAVDEATTILLNVKEAALAAQVFPELTTAIESLGALSASLHWEFVKGAETAPLCLLCGEPAIAEYRDCISRPEGYYCRSCAGCADE